MILRLAALALTALAVSKELPGAPKIGTAPANPKLPLAKSEALPEGPPAVAENEKLEKFEKSTGQVGIALTEEDFKAGKALDAELAKQTPAERRAHFDKAMGHVKHEDVKMTTPSSRVILREVRNHWPDARVPYTMDEAFSADFKALIAAAMTEVHEKTCIRWVPKTEADTDFVHIYTTGASACVATLGYHEGHGKHDLELKSGADGGCKDKGVVIHEMMHNLGIGHEHSRPDRDQFLTVDWTNLPLASASNHFRHSWITDTDNLPKCSIEGVSLATADFSNCVSGNIVEDYGVGYDKDSIMHYGIKLFAADTSKNVLTPKDPSITSLGSYELTDKDVLKMQKAYGCDSRCGGWQKSESGGSVTGLASDAKSPCEWILETAPGKGIEIAITQIAGPTDCSTDYLEVRLGDKSDGQLVGKFCSTAGTVKINNYKVWAKWVRPTSTAASATLTAKWTTFDFSCCGRVMLENVERDNGLFIKQTKNYGDRGYYTTKTGGMHLYFYLDAWRLGSDDPFASDSPPHGVKNLGWEYCPEEVGTKWQYYGTGADGKTDWQTDADGKMRCSDCAQWPDADECATCCDKLMFEKIDRDGGTYMKQAAEYNERSYYKKEDGSAYIIWHQNNWKTISDNPTTATSFSSGVRNQGSEFCPEKLTAKWETFGSAGWAADTDATARCSDCAKFPAAEECAVCCDELEAKSDWADLQTGTYHGQWMAGNFKAEPNDHNGHKLYKSVAFPSMCLAFHTNGKWTMDDCNDLGGGYYMVAPGTKCARLSTGWQGIIGGAFADIPQPLVWSCAGGNPTVPAPATEAPTAPATAAPTLPPTTPKTSGQCQPCKSVTTGPEELRGTFILDVGNTEATRTDCKDSCVYKRGEETFCFSAGGFPVDSCPAP